MPNVFETLNAVNVNGHVEERNGLNYLPWAWAWAEVKKLYPDASYTIWKNENNLPYVYDPQTGYMVYTTVTIDGTTYEMWLPVMDSAHNAMKSEPYSYRVRNNAFKYARKAEDGRFYDKYGNEQKEFIEKRVDAATMFDINTTLMRCLTKNLAMFGLGLYIYANADLPEQIEDDDPKIVKVDSVKAKKAEPKAEPKPEPKIEPKVAPRSVITDDQRNELLGDIGSAFDSKDERNGVYKQLVNHFKIKSLFDLDVSLFDEAKRYISSISRRKSS